VILIEKLRHQLTWHRAHRSCTLSETAEQLQLALETREIAAAALTARTKLADIKEKDRPKRLLIRDHILRIEIEICPGVEACANFGHRLLGIGDDLIKELK
jgi:transposase